MEGLLKQIVATNNVQTRMLEEQTGVLGKILNVEQERARNEEKRLEAEEQARKREEANKKKTRSPLDEILAALKGLRKEQDKKKKKGIFDMLGDMLGGLLKPLKEIGKILLPKIISGLKALLPVIAKALVVFGKAAIVTAAAAGVALTTAKTAQNVREGLGEILSSSGKTKDGIKYTAADITDLRDAERKHYYATGVNLDPNNPNVLSQAGLARMRQYDDVTDLLREQKGILNKIQDAEKNSEFKTKRFEQALKNAEDKYGDRVAGLSDEAKQQKLLQLEGEASQLGKTFKEMNEAAKVLTDTKKEEEQVVEKLNKEYLELGVTDQQLVQLQVEKGRRGEDQIPESMKGKIKGASATGKALSSFGEADIGDGEDLNYTSTPRATNDAINGLEDAVNDLRDSLGGDDREGYINGGFVGTVPNMGGNGDRFRTMVEEGSVVLNQRAAGYQRGGMVPVMLEQGEQVYGPNDPMAGPALVMNSLIPRFQNGGVVDGDTTSKGRDEGDGIEGKAGQSTLDKLDFALGAKRAHAPVGRCVTGSLDTMEVNGVPNPAATGQDVGNNPRGGAAQLINSFGWGAAYGSPITLDSPYGAAPSKVLSATQYEKLVDKGKIPSGAIVFQTRHSSWNGTSPGSSGYDMAIAQDNGGYLWNGVDAGKMVYGNTQKVMVLTPGGGGADTGGPGTEPGDTDTSGGKSRPMSFLEGIASRLGQLGEGVTGEGGQFLSDFGKAVTGILGALGPLGGILNMMMSPLSGMLMKETGGGSGSNHKEVSGQAAGDMKAGRDLIMEAGVPKKGADYLAANIMQESAWNGQRSWGEVLGDGSDRNGGLVSWMDGVAHGSTRLSKIEEWLGKPIDQATDGEQINAMMWEMKNEYPKQYKTFMNPNSTDAQLRDASYRYWGYGEEGARFKYAEQLQGMQTGGMAQMRGYSSSTMANKSAEQFIEQIASAAQPVIVPVPMGGGGNGGGGRTEVVGGGPDTSFPTLPSQDNSIVAMEYKYRITMGASV